MIGWVKPTVVIKVTRNSNTLELDLNITPREFFELTKTFIPIFIFSELGIGNAETVITRYFTQYNTHADLGTYEIRFTNGDIAVADSMDEHYTIGGGVG